MKIGLSENCDLKEINFLLKKIFSNISIPKISKEHSEKIIITNPIECDQLDLLIINKISDYSKTNFFIRKLSDNGVIILNIDENEHNTKINFGGHCIITYGFSNKASVTASSVCEYETKTIQCCIQRSIPTFSGKVIEEQEFSVNVKNKEVSNILAVITTALLSDVEISDIISIF